MGTPGAARTPGAALCVGTPGAARTPGAALGRHPRCRTPSVLQLRVQIMFIDGARIEERTLKVRVSLTRPRNADACLHALVF